MCLASLLSWVDTPLVCLAHSDVSSTPHSGQLRGGAQLTFVEQMNSHLVDEKEDRSRGKGSARSPQSVNIIQCLGCASAGIWSAALNGDLGRVKYLIQKAADPSQPDSAGYTALVSWGGASALGSCSLGGDDVCLFPSPTLSSLPGGFPFKHLMNLGFFS